MERDPAIAATWRYLLAVSPAGALALPDVQPWTARGGRDRRPGRPAPHRVVVRQRVCLPAAHGRTLVRTQGRGGLKLRPRRVLWGRRRALASLDSFPRSATGA